MRARINLSHAKIRSPILFSSPQNHLKVYWQNLEMCFNSLQVKKLLRVNGVMVQDSQQQPLLCASVSTVWPMIWNSFTREPWSRRLRRR